MYETYYFSGSFDGFAPDGKKQVPENPADGFDVGIAGFGGAGAKH